jgi:hypothetical protein
MVFQEQTSGGTSTIPFEQVRLEPEPTIIEDGEDSSNSEPVHLNQFDSSDERDHDDIYSIEHDPGLRLPISTSQVMM